MTKTEKRDGKWYKVTYKVKKKEKILTDIQRQEIFKAFELFDADKSGSIDIHELKEAMKALGVYLKKAQLKAIMDKLDEDGSGTIELDEFTTLMKEKINERDPKEELVKVFRTYDEENIGLINAANLKNVAQELKQEVTDKEIKGMIYEADRDSDGFVDVFDFLAIMRKAKLY